jgi:hypothetical protein
MYFPGHLEGLVFLLCALDLALEIEGELLDVVLPLLFELFELCIVVQRGIFKVLGLHGQLRLQLMDPPAVNFLETVELMLKALVLNGDILILVEEVVDLELQF